MWNGTLEEIQDIVKDTPKKKRALLTTDDVLRHLRSESPFATTDTERHQRVGGSSHHSPSAEAELGWLDTFNPGNESDRYSDKSGYGPLGDMTRDEFIGSRYDPEC